MKYALSDLRLLVNFLRGRAAKWWAIGLQLELDPGVLATIEHDYRGNAERCLAEVIQCWLQSSHECTSEQLALALSQPAVGEEELANRIRHGQPWRNVLFSIATCMTTIFSLLGLLSYLLIVRVHLCKIVNLIFSWLKSLSYMVVVRLKLWKTLLVFCTTCLIGTIYSLYSKTEVGYTSSLPVANDNLIGRNAEMKEIVAYFKDDYVKAINIYGPPGIGKSTIAKHIGHAVLKQGVDVHYVMAQYIQGVDTLTKEIMTITNSTRKATLKQWANNLERKSLIILDNLDGIHWYPDEALQDLLNNFIYFLNRYSNEVKILVTSQEEIFVARWKKKKPFTSAEKLKSYRLKALDAEMCSLLLLASVTGTNTSYKDANKICKLVENNPFLVKLSASILRQPYGASINNVIDRIETYSNRNRMLMLAYKSISNECYVCSLLLLRLRRFHLDQAVRTMSEITELYADADFHIGDCIHDLSAASILQKMSPSFTNESFYDFHTVFRFYLESKRVKRMELLTSFWKQQAKALPFLWMRRRFNFYKEDLEALSNLLHLVPPSAEQLNLALKLLDNSSFYCSQCPYQQLQSTALKVLGCPITQGVEIIEFCITHEIYEKVDCKVKSKQINVISSCEHRSTIVPMCYHVKCKVAKELHNCKIVTCL